jgi:hypothetical protein
MGFPLLLSRARVFAAPNGLEKAVRRRVRVTGSDVPALSANAALPRKRTAVFDPVRCCWWARLLFPQGEPDKLGWVHDDAGTVVIRREVGLMARGGTTGNTSW